MHGGIPDGYGWTHLKLGAYAAAADAAKRGAVPMAVAMTLQDKAGQVDSPPALATGAVNCQPVLVLKEGSIGAQAGCGGH